MISPLGSEASFDSSLHLDFLRQPQPEVDEIEAEKEKVQAYLTDDQKSWQTRPAIFHTVHGMLRSPRALRFVLPTFVQTWKRDGSSVKEVQHQSAFLDGMRGLAAFVVFICHLSHGTWDVLHTYGTGAPGQNTRWMQLPIVRLFYSGPPMVAIFFVISGFALSLKPVKLMRARNREALLNTTSSSLFRRALRLYMPCLASTFLVVCLAQLGVYDRTADFANNLRAIKGYHVRSKASNFDQLSEWAISMFRTINVFDWRLYAGTTNYDLHLWTIPVEFRCSLALFLTHLLVARMRTRTRLITISFLCWWGLHWDRWDMIPFWSGQILAELYHIKASAAGPSLQVGPEKQRKPWLNDRSWQIIYLIVFLVGCYLASYPTSDGHQAPGYMWLDVRIPPYWTQRHRFWPNIGAALIVWSGGNANILRRIFTSSPVQYLGNISFPLYLVHGPVICTFGYMSMETMYTIFNIQVRSQFELAFVIAAVATIIITVWVADIFWRVVDIPSVRFARWVEDRFFES